MSAGISLAKREEMDKNNYAKCTIKRPDDAILIETPVTSFWLDKDGILYSQPRDIKRTEENVKQSFAILKERLGNKKVCLISDTTYTPPYTMDARLLVAEEMPKLVKAVAIISCSPMGRMVGNTLFLARKTPYPVKMFDDPEEAKEWIRQYV
jgi:hypothetical protein